MAIKKYSVKASAEAKAVVASKGEYISAAQFSDTLKSAKKKFNEKFKKGPYACAEVQGMGYIYYNDGSKIYVPNVLRSYDDALAQVKKLNAGGAGKVAASKSFTKTVKASSSLKVKPYVINNGQSGQYYGLKNAEDNQVLHSAPNNWKSEKGAINWAKKKGYEVVDSACGKKSVKAGRYSDVVPYEDRKYWYFTTHGIGPGMLPKGVNVLDTQVGQNRKGTWGDYLLLDAVLNTDELREYDLVELAPLDKEPTIKPYKNKNTISVFDSCGKKPIETGRTKIRPRDQWVVDDACRYTLFRDDTGDLENSDNKAELIRLARKIDAPAWVEDNSNGDIVFNNMAQQDKDNLDTPGYKPKSAWGKKSVKSSKSVKSFGVKASKSAKKRVAATKNVYDVLSDFKHLKQVINDYYYREFGDDSEADFSNSKNIALGYTTYGDNDEWELKLTADLENHKFIYTVVYPDGSYATNEESYNDFADMAEAIEDASFDDLMSLQYFPDLEEDIYLQASCGKKHKAVKSSMSKHNAAKRTIKASDQDHSAKSIKCWDNGNDVWEYQESYDYYYDEEPPAHIAKELERLAKLTDKYTDRWFEKFEELHPGERFSIVYSFPDVDEAVGYTLDDAEYRPDEIRASTNITATIDSEYNTQVLAYIADYITDNYPIWVSVDYVVYDGPNDWSVDIFADSQMVANDFVFFLEENNKYLRDRLEEAGILWDVISAHEYHFQFYPYQEQWSAPYIEIDNTVLNSFGDTSEVESALMEEIADYRSTILNYLPEINNSLDNILADYDSGITASTEVSADLQLSRDKLDRKKYNWSDNKNSITDIDGYVKDLADGVVERFPNLTYDISDEAITFTDETGAVVYIQPIDEIVPEKDDLDNDITELGDAIQHANEEADWFSQEQVWDDDPDYATRAVELSRDINCAEETVDIDDLEYITGDSDDLPDMGYGFDSNGDPVDESTVEELERIAQEILDKSEIHNIDEYADIHNFNYYASIPYIQESFDITFTYVADIYELSERGLVNDYGIFTTVAPYNIHFNVRCKNGEVEYAECTGVDVKDNYVKDVELKNFNLDALVQFATDLVNPIAMDIYNATTNI